MKIYSKRHTKNNVNLKIESSEVVSGPSFKISVVDSVLMVWLNLKEKADDLKSEKTTDGI